MMSYFATECQERSQSIEGPCDDFFEDWVYPVGHSMALGSMKVSISSCVLARSGVWTQSTSVCSI